jgi:hypothetical protein
MSSRQRINYDLPIIIRRFRGVYHMVLGFLKYKELRDKDLQERAEELGVSLALNLEERMAELGAGRPSYGKTTLYVGGEPELQRRVREAERARRDRSFWIVALISSR